MLPILAFSAPTIDFSVNRTSISVKTVGSNKTMDDCVQNGLQLLYRYEFEMCDKNSLWFDSCKGLRTQLHSIKFDPVVGVYRVFIDRFDDGRDPKNLQIESRTTAINRINNVANMPLAFLAHGDKQFLKKQDLYVDVNVTCICKEEYARSLAELTSFITFGLVELKPFDSGRTRIELKK